MSPHGSFHPPQRILMGPGPSDVSPRVLEAMGRPTIGHLDPEFVGLMEELKALLQYTFQTENELTLPVSGPGSAGMETCFVNLVEPGDTVIVCKNGVFGGRMEQNVLRCGARPVIVEDEWGRAVSVDKVEAALKAHPEAKIIAFVHAETSTGAMSDAQAIAKLARAHDCLTILDTVTSLAGIPVRIDDWGIDACYSGSQKCLSCTPGLSPVTFGPRAIARLEARTRPVQSWFLDLKLVMSYWGKNQKRAYHHTAPINALYALHESLLILKEEGLEASWARHQKMHQALRAGLEAMGLGLLVPESERLPQLNVVTVPDGVDEAKVRKHLLDAFSLEIGAGLGALAGKVWRIGLMGQSARAENVLSCLKALEDALGDQAKAGVAEGAARQALEA